MTSKGQVTIPAAIREFFQLRAGDVLDFYTDERTRCVRLRARNRSSESMFGVLNKYVDPRAPALSEEGIDQAVGDHVAEDDARIVRQYEEWREFQTWKRNKGRDAAE